MPFAFTFPNGPSTIPSFSSYFSLFSHLPLESREYTIFISALMGLR
ncbi:hypothetical protein POPTR_004G234150v4 [Populus trichocarpa]|uniref:Uncharacterized protein n=1 Tax=Populus trichocarpa TaxID=3694 RepID=A0ACC0T6D6_POPTR|nr:hypothetical protein BDE02_04G200200 [Populus trichocarpa]KAI9397119.1 hypothetical protein POPTR_004G234150v4 [Populus trichocarpa]